MPRIRSGATERAVGLVSALVVVLLALAVPARGAFPGDNGSIAFRRITLGHFRDITFPIAFDVVSVRADGSGLTNLTGGSPTGALRPAWSPDGRRIAFDAERIGLLIMNADGTGLAPVPGTRPGDWAPAWAPGGGRLAFVHNNRVDASDVYTMRLDGMGRRRLTNDPATDMDPAWSPDGSRIAFSSDRDGLPHVYVMTATGTGAMRLEHDLYASGSPDWSPDGSRIAFAGSTGDGGEIYVMDADGSQVVAITDHPRSDSEPVWSPDGSRIAFATARHGEFISIDTMNPDGSGLEQVIGGPGFYDGEPSWQPLVPYSRSDFPNGAQFCKAERERLGAQAFAQRYGGPNAHGSCVSIR